MFNASELVGVYEVPFSLLIEVQLGAAVVAAETVTALGQSYHWYLTTVALYAVIPCCVNADSELEELSPDNEKVFDAVSAAPNVGDAVDVARVGDDADGAGSVTLVGVG